MKNFLLQRKQFLLYCLIGVSGTTLDFSVYSGLLRFGLLGYQAANVAGYASGTLLTFLLNAHFNFRVTDKLARRMACCFGIAFLGLALSAVLLHVLIGRYHANPYCAKAATLVVVVLLQYNLNRLYSFRKSN